MSLRLTNRPLLAQFIIPMILVGIIALTITIYSATELEQSVEELKNFQEFGDKRLRIIEDIETSLAYYRALSLRHMASESAVNMRDIAAEIREVEKNIQSYFELITTQLVADHPDSLEETQTVLLMSQEYIGAVRGVLEQSADFEKEEAFALMSRAENQYLAFINSSLQALKRHEFDYLANLRTTIIAGIERNLITTLAIGISGGVMVLLIAFIVTRRITKRLDHLLEWSKMISAGNLSASLETDSRDELGKLTGAMNSMAASIRIAQKGLTEAKLGAEKAAEEIQMYANAFENSGEAMLISDKNNKIINVNSAFTRETGYKLEDVAGRNPRLLSSGQTPKEVYQEMWQELNEKGFWQGELWDKRKDGDMFPKWAVISAIRDARNEVLFYMSSFTDISERKAAEEQIERLAHHDILTGLLNRFSMESHLEQAISNAGRDQKKLAVLFIDLDRFKNVNDSLGHHAGDELLIKVGKRLRHCVRESDVVSRIGGDEFVVVSTGIKDNSHAAVLAEKILIRISMPYDIGGNEIMISPSIGISVYPEDGRTVDDLMRTADVAMYHAKDLGRNTYQYFTESMLQAANKRISIERELRVALSQEQLTLHYQPQLGSEDLDLNSLEALVRWEHPDQGIIPPDLFIPIAEETGLINDLGRWVINEAVRQLLEWKSAGLTGFRVSINLSTKQLQSESLYHDVSSVLRRCHVDAADIEFEITETAAMNDPDLAVQRLNDLRSLGVSLSIDDFGTGYSSLAYLKRLPIDTLKLDKSFVRDIETDQNDAEICMASITLAHNLGMNVVAEGVETEGQRNFLTRHQCDYLQGYLFSRPLPASDMSKYLEEKLLHLITS